MQTSTQSVNNTVWFFLPGSLMYRYCCQTSRLEVGIKTKLNARLALLQRVDLFEGNVSANKISLPQGQNCTLSITLLYNYLPVYHTIYCSHF